MIRTITLLACIFVTLTICVAQSDKDMQRLLDITKQMQTIAERTPADDKEQARIDKEICDLIREVKAIVKRNPDLSAMGDMMGTLDCDLDITNQQNSSALEVQPKEEPVKEYKEAEGPALIKYSADVAVRLDANTENYVKLLMREARVTEITITDTNRSRELQVERMYKNHFAILYPAGPIKNEPKYAWHGLAILKAGDDYVIQKLGLNPSYNDAEKQKLIAPHKEEIIARMLARFDDELLAAAAAEGKLMHVGREDRFIVFDVGRVVPDGFIQVLEATAIKYNKNEAAASGEICRVLGTANKIEEGRLHIEIVR